MKDQHTKIKGYRDLSQEEVDLMNRIKVAGAVLLDLQVEVASRLRTDEELKKVAAAASKAAPEHESSDESVELRRFMAAEPHRWAAISKTDLQTGLMALVRAVAQPAGY